MLSSSLRAEANRTAVHDLLPLPPRSFLFFLQITILLRFERAKSLRRRRQRTATVGLLLDLDENADGPYVSPMCSVFIGKIGHNAILDCAQICLRSSSWQVVPENIMQVWSSRVRSTWEFRRRTALAKRRRSHIISIVILSWRPSFKNISTSNLSCPADGVARLSQTIFITSIWVESPMFGRFRAIRSYDAIHDHGCSAISQLPAYRFMGSKPLRTRRCLLFG